MGIMMKRKLKPKEENVKKNPKVTLEEIEGISTDDDDENLDKTWMTQKPKNSKNRRRGIEMGDREDEEEEGELEARALRQAILEGVFDKFHGGNDGDTSNKFEEHEEDVDDSDSDDSRHLGDDDEQEEQVLSTVTANRTKALLTKAEELSSSHNWVETFDILSKDQLPFHDKSTRLDVHDDLKRELAFYNMALEAVREAKIKCKAAKVPFTRPDDFFAEMIKTDDHMAKVKDRLIFETKKIAAFEQRKANKEQKVRAKEVRQHKTLEKNKRKRQHLEQVNEWAKVAAQNRGNNNDDIIEKQFLNRMSNNNSSSNHQPPVKGAKRIAMDKKYGFGGKRGKFKQMDKKTINDMSSFNPRGNFAAGGMKKKNIGNKKNQGANRPGKSKRMVARQRKQS